MTAIIYRGFSEKAGRVKSWKSSGRMEDEQGDIRQLYMMFDAETEITCIDPKTKEILDIANLEDFYNNPKL